MASLDPAPTNWSQEFPLHNSYAPSRVVSVPAELTSTSFDKDLVSSFAILLLDLWIDLADYEVVWAAVRSCNMSGAEIIAAAAGDSAEASRRLAQHVDRNITLLSNSCGNIASVASGIRADLGLTSMTPASLSVMNLPIDTVLARQDRSALFECARTGASLLMDENFIPTSTSLVYPPVRNLFKRVRPAVLSLLANLVDTGRAVVLPVSVARGLGPSSHTLDIHWVEKPTDPFGRLIADASGGDHSPNGNGDLRKVARATFGAIELPREHCIAEYILNRVAKMDNPTINVDDVKGAFGTLSLSAESAALSSLEVKLDDDTDVAVVLTSVYFGGTSCPFLWNQVSRTLERLLKLHDVEGLIYVDDIIRVTDLSRVECDGQKTKQLICDLLSPGTYQAWAEKKAVRGAISAQFVGWSWDVVNKTVSFTKRSVIRCYYRLTELDGRKTASIKSLQGISSLVHRFSMVFTAWAPLARVLYGSFAGTHWRTTEVVKSLSPAVQGTITVLRRLLRDVWNKGANWSAPLSSLVPRSATLSIQFDGSTTGLGGVSPAAGLDPNVSICAFAFRETYDVFEGKVTCNEQNGSELLAAIWGIASAIFLGARNTTISFVGDSVTVLTWLEKRVRSPRVTRAFFLLVALLRVGGITIGVTDWIASEVNVIPDQLSRDVLIEQCAALKTHRADPLPVSWRKAALVYVDLTKSSSENATSISDDLERADELAEHLVM